MVEEQSQISSRICIETQGYSVHASMYFEQRPLVTAEILTTKRYFQFYFMKLLQEVINLL